MTPIDPKRLDLHQPQSLDQLRTLTEGLAEIGPLSTKHGEVSFGSVRWHDPEWTPHDLRWTKRLEFDVTINSSHTSAVNLELLWPVGDGHQDSIPFSDARAVGPATFFDGRPLVAVSQRKYRPGLHILRSPHTAGGRRLVLTPDVGPSLLFRPTAIKEEVSFQARIPGVGFLKHPEVKNPEREPLRQRPGAAGQQPGKWRPLDKYLGRDGGPPLAHFSGAIREAVGKTLNVDLAQATLRDFGIRLQSLDIASDSLPSFAYELSDDVLRTFNHGDLIYELIIETTLAATRRFHDDIKAFSKNMKTAYKNYMQEKDGGTLATILARGIRSRVRRNYRAMLYGRGDQPALLIGDDDRNTLANCEIRRRVTRYSRDIPQDTRYWLWTRDIHSDDRGRLCPLQTPESQDVGYVRFLALGAEGGNDDHGAQHANDMWDLSPAASLIPFINHNDPARSSIGSKNLKQAVPVEGLSVPRIRSGTESLIAERHGVARVPADLNATVTEVLADRIITRRDDGTEEVLSFGFASPTGFRVDGRWHVIVKKGQVLKPGAVFAHAPDVTFDDDECDRPVLALGSDVLVAFTPWHGMNYEDAIVVSDAIVDRFASTHLLQITETLLGSEGAVKSVADGAEVVAGQGLLSIVGKDRLSTRSVVAPESGVVESVRIQTVPMAQSASGATERYSSVATVSLRVRRPLAVGDKLTNRHGGKGVVSMIVPESEMPRLPDGRAVEMILNPLGVIRRMNIGQLLEANESLLDYLCGGGPRTVGRRMTPQQRAKLAKSLAKNNAPGGRLVITCADGTKLARHGGVVVGWQHMLKLDHLAADKLNHRMTAPPSPLDRQPAKGSMYQGGILRGGAKRCGEMELWALRARGAHAFIAETLTTRSGFRGPGNPTLESVEAHLAVGQLAVAHPTGEIRLLDDPDTQSLPSEALKQILEPGAYGFTPTGHDEDPLYRSDIHGDPRAALCKCGSATQPRVRCDDCLTVARPGAARSQVRFHVELPMPVPHPWFASRKATLGSAQMLQTLPILPPAYRVLGFEALDSRYKRLIRLCALKNVARAAVSGAVNAILGTVGHSPADGTIAGRLSGKFGLIRRGLRGRRNNLVGRSVIAPCTELGLEEIGLPRSTMAELRLDCDDVVVVNRQPTLRPTNIVALKVQRTDGDRFALHPLMSKQLAGDFDGDEATVHQPASELAARQCWDTMRPAAELLSDADGSPILGADLDFSLGLQLLSSTISGREEIRNIVGAEVIREALGDPWANALSPEDANEVLRVLYRRRAAASVPVVEHLFAAAVRACVGWSASLLDDQFRDAGSHARSAGWLAEAIAAGVAGSDGGLNQLLVKRGSLPTFVPDAPTADIASCFLNGLANDDLFTTTSAALATLAQKKLVTPRAGNLTKQLADALSDFEVIMADCGCPHSPRTVLRCRVEAGCCAACVGELPSGRVVEVGESIGLRAALLIGERCTQQAMKTFHGGGTGVAVGGVVAELEAAFGGGRINHPRDGHISFSNAVKESQLDDQIVFRPPQDIEQLLDRLSHETCDALGGAVDRSMIDVVLKRLRDAADEHKTDLPLKLAGRRGHPLLDASVDGKLETLISAIDSPGSEIGAPQSNELYLDEGDHFQMRDYSVGRQLAQLDWQPQDVN